MRFLAPWDIGRGEFGKEMIEEFRAAQVISRDSMVPVTINVKIVVLPPEINQPGLCECTGEITRSVPKPKAKRYFLDIDQKAGFAVRSGKTELEVLQYELDIPENKTAQFPQSDERQAS
jgi:hypothetical protein